MSDKTQSEIAGILTDVAFREPAAAAKNLRGLREGLTPQSYAAVCRLLAEGPDPDTILVLLDRLVESSPRETALFAAQPSILHYTSLIFGHSSWLGETLVQNPDLLRALGRVGDLESAYSPQAYREKFGRWRAALPNTDLPESLARFRKREYVRILLRELLGIAKLAESTGEISALADALVEEATSTVNTRLRQRYGPPQWVADGRLQYSRFAVVSLGKLGGDELNYSSDIDLLFLYDGGIEPPNARLSNREYFIQLAQQTTELLSRRTQEGQVFRIDLRLRPQGHEGELAAGLSKAIRYYSEVAEDWELQAMIKARHTAGDVGITRQFVRAIAPYIYRPNVNFAAVKTALQSRERIDKRGVKMVSGRPAQRSIDVKLDRGGIRDIEFLVQCLQRVYGGEEGWLRSRGTLFALQKLHDKEHISGKDFHHLTKAYEFLRHVEHYLQLRRGQQTHQLPKGTGELKVLARCMSRAEIASRSPEEFVRQVEGRMAAVAEIYRRIVYQEQSHQFIDQNGNLNLQVQVPPSAENSYTQIMQRLALDAPQLLAAIARADLSQHARHNLDRFFSSAATSSDRYGAVLRSPGAVENALQIFEHSEYLTDILVRHPAEVYLLDALTPRAGEEPFSLFVVPDLTEGEQPDPMLAYLANNQVDRLEAMSIFRQQFRDAVFVANAANFFRRRDVFEKLERNSAIADRALSYALAIADAPPGFAIMALGRLGSREFDLLSDADVLFVAHESTRREEARRAAEKVMEFLTAYTRDGTVFPVDARLRPQGREGELVTTPVHLARYFEVMAQPWEAITYLRLRFVAGDRRLGAETIETARSGINSVARRPQFGEQLRNMRTRLEASEALPNLKTGPGGTYDIDFLCGKLQAQHQLWNNGNLLQRIDLLRQQSLIDSNDSGILMHNAGFLRALEHAVRLVTGRAGKWLPDAEHAQTSIMKLLTEGGIEFARTSLAETLHAICNSTRDICRKHLFD